MKKTARAVWSVVTACGLLAASAAAAPPWGGASTAACSRFGAPICDAAGVCIGCAELEPRANFLASAPRGEIYTDRSVYNADDSSAQMMIVTEPLRDASDTRLELRLSSSAGDEYTASGTGLVGPGGGTAVALQTAPLAAGDWTLTAAQFVAPAAPGHGGNLLRAPFDLGRARATANGSAPWQNLGQAELAQLFGPRYTVTDTDPNAAAGLAQTAPLPPGSATVVASVSIWKTPSPASYPGLRLTLGADAVAEISVDHAAGGNCQAIRTAGTVGWRDAGEYCRVWAELQNPSNAAPARLELLAAAGDSPAGNWSAAAVGRAEFSHPLLETDPALTPSPPQGRNLLSRPANVVSLGASDVSPWDDLVSPNAAQLTGGAFQLTDNNAGNHEGIRQTVAIAPGATALTAQVRVRRGSGVNPGLALNFGAGKLKRIGVDIGSAQALHPHPLNEPLASGVIVEAGYLRVWLTAAVPAGATTAEFAVYPAVIAGGGDFVWRAAHTGSQIFRDPHLAVGTDPEVLDRKRNQLYFSEDVTQPLWQTFGASPGAGASPRVAQNDDDSFTLTDAHSGTVRGLVQTPALDPALQRVVASVRIGRAAGATSLPALRLRLHGNGAANKITVLLNPETGACRLLGGSTSSIAIELEDAAVPQTLHCSTAGGAPPPAPGEYLRLVVSADIDGHDQAEFALLPAATPGADLSWGAGGIGATRFRDPQLEYGAAASHYQRTNASPRPGSRATTSLAKSGDSAVTPFPPGGLDITLSPLASGSRWPVRMGVPLPNLYPDPLFVLEENGVPIPLGQKIVARWDRDGNAKWVHLDFIGRWVNGVPANYKLHLTQTPAAVGGSLVLNETPSHIHVDTGRTAFWVAKDAFSLNGYGPYIVDRVRYQPAPDALVEIEDHNPAAITIRAAGWFEGPGGERFCRFVTRITAHHDSPAVFIKHQIILTEHIGRDARHQISDAGWEVAAPAGVFSVGVPGAAPLQLVTPDYAHQYRSDAFRTGGGSGGAKLHGWASAGAIKLFMRNIWQKFPNEFAHDGTTLSAHFWPAHNGAGGLDAFDAATEELPRRHIYKFRSFLEGESMDLTPKESYIRAFDDYARDNPRLEGAGVYQYEGIDVARWWRQDGERLGTIRANATGVAIANELALVDAPFAGFGIDEAGFADNFQQGVAAAADPVEVTRTLALGRIAPRSGQWAVLEDAFEASLLSWARRGQIFAHDYGMWNFGDTHTLWFSMGDETGGEERPSLHRNWVGGHHQNVSTGWLLFARGGSAEILRWARENTDHFLNIDLVHHGDEAGGRRLGAMQHIGFKPHWGVGGSASGLVNHYTDSDALLLAWLIDGDRAAYDAYRLWLSAFIATRPDYDGRGDRLTNVPLVQLIGAYGAVNDPILLPWIRHHIVNLLDDLDYELSGASPPLQSPMWQPLWLNAYYELTRDEVDPVVDAYLHADPTARTRVGPAVLLAWNGDPSHLGNFKAFFQDYPKQLCWRLLPTPSAAPERMVELRPGRAQTPPDLLRPNPNFAINGPGLHGSRHREVLFAHWLAAAQAHTPPAQPVPLAPPVDCATAP